MGQPDKLVQPAKIAAPAACGGQSIPTDAIVPKITLSVARTLDIPSSLCHIEAIANTFVLFLAKLVRAPAEITNAANIHNADTFLFILLFFNSYKKSYLTFST